MATKALDFGDRQARDAALGQGLANFVEFEGFDDGGDLLHAWVSKRLGTLNKDCEGRRGRLSSIRQLNAPEWAVSVRPGARWRRNRVRSGLAQWVFLVKAQTA
ncbi:MAG: hypothetical protein Fur007_09250 [Rhodoferax sp.]